MANVKLSAATPVVTRFPGGHARWERTGTIRDVARFALGAEEHGYHHITCSEHVAVPAGVVAQRGGTYWDPLATFGYLAATTTTLRFATNVLVLGYHHPLAIAKRYGTLDRVTSGRLILGVGVGSLAEEFELLDAPFTGRGPRADDAIRALRAALASSAPVYDGEHYSFNGFVLDPTAVQERVPIWVGGRTLRSLKRAVNLGDGWCPFGIGPATASKWLTRLEVPADFEVTLSPTAPIDPTGDPDGAADALRELADAGATTAHLHFVHHSISHLIEQLEAATTIHRSLTAATDNDAHASEMAAGERRSR